MCSSCCSGPSWNRANAPFIVDLGQQAGWHQYYCVLSRAKWSARAASRLLLGQLVAPFLPAGPLVFGLDEIRKRRWGPRIAARSIYRAMPCAAPISNWSSAAACVASACACLRPCPGPPAVGPHPCSPGWFPRPAGPRRRAADTKKSRIGPGKRCCNWPTGYPVVSLPAWARVATPCWRCWPRRVPTPPGSRACAWTRPCMPRPRPA